MSALLLQSVTSTVEPLVAVATESGLQVSSHGQVKVLSPGVEVVVGKLLELALEIGLKVRKRFATATGSFKLLFKNSQKFPILEITLYIVCTLAD